MFRQDSHDESARTVSQRDSDRERISADIERFLESGGKIEVCEKGGVTNDSDFYEYQRERCLDLISKGVDLMDIVKTIGMCLTQVRIYERQYRKGLDK